MKARAGRHRRRFCMIMNSPRCPENSFREPTLTGILGRGAGGHLAPGRLSRWLLIATANLPVRNHVAGYVKGVLALPGRNKLGLGLDDQLKV